MARSSGGISTQYIRQGEVASSKCGNIRDLDIIGAMANTSLRDEFQYYLDHQDEIVKQYDGQFVVIKNSQVIGTYNDELTAVTETQKSEELGTFLIQKVSRGSGDYTQTFHSRAVFS